MSSTRVAVVYCLLFALVATGTAVGETLQPGSVLTKATHEVARGVLPEELIAKVASGEIEIRVQEATDLGPSAAYVEATEKHAGQVRLRDDGSLEGYVAGQPFPALATDDPQCGLKAAWNLRYHDSGRGSEVWGVLRQIEASGRITRQVEFNYIRAYGMHLWPQRDNRWEDEGVLYKEFYQALAPLDLRNLMSLKFRYDDDRRTDVNWAYAPGERKVRRLQVPHEESTLGTDLLREDYYGFSGYVHAHRWKCLGAGTYLAPVGVRAARAKLDSHGYPADPWEARETIVLEATPENGSHPYGRRVLYLDRKLFVPLYVLIYDASGRHEKTLFTVYGDPRHYPDHEAVRVPIWLAEVMLNHQTGKSTITEVTRGIFDTPVAEDRFTPDQMVALGR